MILSEELNVLIAENDKEKLHQFISRIQTISIDTVSGIKFGPGYISRSQWYLVRVESRATCSISQIRITRMVIRWLKEYTRIANIIGYPCKKSTNGNGGQTKRV